MLAGALLAHLCLPLTEGNTHRAGPSEARLVSGASSIARAIDRDAGLCQRTADDRARTPDDRAKRGGESALNKPACCGLHVLSWGCEQRNACQLRNSLRMQNLGHRSQQQMTNTLPDALSEAWFQSRCAPEQEAADHSRPAGPVPITSLVFVQHSCFHGTIKCADLF